MVKQFKVGTAGDIRTDVAGGRLHKRLLTSEDFCDHNFPHCHVRHHPDSECSDSILWHAYSYFHCRQEGHPDFSLRKLGNGGNECVVCQFDPDKFHYHW